MVSIGTLRIAVFSRSLPVHRGSGGMEQLAWNLVQEWVARGHEVTVFTTQFDSESAISNFEVRQLPGPPGRYSRQWFDATVAAAKHLDVDVIVGVSAGAHRLMEQRHLLPRVPIVMQAHGTALDEMLTSIGLRTVRSAASAVKRLPSLIRDCKLYKRYDSVIAVGPSVTASLERYPRRFRPKRVDLVLNGVPDRTPMSSTVATTEPGTREAIFVGRLYREKGADLAIEAAAKWGIAMRIVGEGPERPNLESLAQRLGSDVSFVGHLHAEQVQEHLSRASVLVVPSRRREGLPLVVLEGLAAGIPVVVSPLVARTLGSPLPSGVIAMTDITAAAAADALAAAETYAAASPTTLPEVYRMSYSVGRYLEVFRDLATNQVRMPPK